MLEAQYQEATNQLLRTLGRNSSSWVTTTKTMVMTRKTISGQRLEFSYKIGLVKQPNCAIDLEILNDDEQTRRQSSPQALNSNFGEMS
jgi:hypothetical protein